MEYIKFKKEYQKSISTKTTTKFLKNTYVELLKESNDTVITNQILTFDKFIGPYNTLIMDELGCLVECKLDNPKLYYDFFSYIEENNYLSIDNIFMVIKSIQVYIDNIKNNFGSFKIVGLANYAPISKTEIEEREFIPSSLKVSIAHNILKFIGLKSELMFGEKNEQKNTYIILHSKSGENDLLYDPLSPIYCDDLREINRESVFVALSKITKKDYKSLISGGIYNFSYDVINNLYNDKLSDYDEKRWYTIGSNIYSYSDQKSIRRK